MRSSLFALSLVACVRPLGAPVPLPPAPLLPALAPRASVPITGGTLRIARDGHTAAISDPDRDRVWLVDLTSLRIKAEVVLELGDEPGRIAEDLGGRFHVALRRGGAIATIDGPSGQLLLRRSICASPRGIEHDDVEDALIVACADGKLITIGIFDRQPRRTIYLEPDLRDVIVDRERVFVTRLRSAELLELEGDGSVIARRQPPPFDLDGLERREVVGRERRVFEPKVAWRTTLGPTGDVWMIHQRAAVFPIDLRIDPEPPPAGRLPYGGHAASPALPGCPPGILHSTLTRWSPSGRVRSTMLLDAVLPVDVAVSPDGSRVAMAFAGNGVRPLAIAAAHGEAACTTELHEPGAFSAFTYEQPVAVAWIDETRLAVQYREPPALVVYGSPMLTNARSVALGARLADDDGDAVFHRATAAGLACASCHPEGIDDGHVWNLGALGGRRRTQPLGGGLGAPFHWAGDLPNVEALVQEVFISRMGGRRLSSTEVDGLAGFLGRLRAPAAGDAHDQDARDRGRALFAERRCDGCHYGPRLTDERNHDVGTGGTLQTPTLLGLATRPPYFHDGRVASLRDRFGAGHSAGHGDLSGLREQDIEDLVEFLASL